MDFIENFNLIEKYIFEIYVSVSLWEYVSFQKQVSFNIEYGYYSLIQWFAIGIGLIFIFGVAKGFLVLWALFGVTIPFPLYFWFNSRSDF